MAPLPRHRPAAEGGYQRGEETRAKIVEAALSLFGEKGYDGASTRDIAERAGVNAPALAYYFDNKEGVYSACVEHIVSRVWENVGESVAAAEVLLASDSVDNGALIEAFCAIQKQVATFLFTSGDPAEWRLFMAREQAGLGHCGTADLVNRNVTRRIYGVSAALISRLSGLPPDDPEVIVRTLAITGQLLAFHLTKRSATEALGWDVIDSRRMETIVRVINEQTVVLLTGMAETREIGRS